MLFCGPETSRNKRMSLLVTVNIYHLLPACLPCLLLLTPCPHAVSNSNQLNLKRFFSWQIIMKDIFSPFSCIYLCRSLWKMLHICTLELTVFLTEERALRVEGKGEGRAGCCTCLLPWGFWRSDYAVMRLREWRICFRKGGSGKKIECAWAGASATNYVAGAFILERELARLYLDREQGAASETFDVFLLPHRPD